MGFLVYVQYAPYVIQVIEAVMKMINLFKDKANKQKLGQPTEDQDTAIKKYEAQLINLIWKFLPKKYQDQATPKEMADFADSVEELVGVVKTLVEKTAALMTK